MIFDAFILAVVACALLVFIILFFVDIAKIMPYDLDDVAKMMPYDRDDVAKIMPYDVPASGPTTVFEETWTSATPDLYESEPITGADESGWVIDDTAAGSGVTIPDPATYAELTGATTDFYLKNNDIKCSSTYPYIEFEYYFPATYGGYTSMFLYNTNADERVFTLGFTDEDEIYVNGGGPYDSNAGRGAWFKVKVYVDYAAKTFDIDINAGQVSLSDVAWGDSTGTDGDMKRLELYISSNANNKARIKNIKVSNAEL